NRAPVVEPVAVSVVGGSSLVLDLSRFATDPDGNRLFFTVTGVTGGVLRLIDGGTQAVFTPTAGFSGAATFRLRADDGALRSEEVTVPVQVAAVVFTRFRIEGADALVGVGATTRLRLIGESAQGDVELDPSVYTVTSATPTVARVSPDGTVLGVTAGAALIEFTLASGGRLAAALTVGTVRDARLIEFYPLSYTLQPSETRQMIVRLRTESAVTDLTGSAAGSRYYVSDPTVASISAEGLLTALKPGVVTVTLVNGGRSERAAVLVATPAANGATVGTGGGMVGGNDVVVGIPAGALTGDTPVRILPYTQAELPFALPSGFDFLGGVRIDVGRAFLEEGLSLEVPAPAGSKPGDVIYIFQPGVLRTGDAAADEQGWLLMDSMVVGNDGRMRTTSPPNLGFMHRPGEGGQYFVPSTTGAAAFSTTTILGLLHGIEDYGTRLQAYQTVTGRGKSAPIVSAQTATGGGPDGPKFFVFPGILGDFLLPMSGTLGYRLETRYSEPVGLVSVGTTDVKVNPGETVTYGLPLPARYVVRNLVPPTIRAITFDFGPDPARPQPRMVLEGTDFLLTTNPFPTAPDFLGDEVEDLFVTIEVGGRDTFDDKGNVQYVGGADLVIDGPALVAPNPKRLEVKIPAGAYVAGGYVTVSRRVMAPVDGEFEIQTVVGNPSQLIPSNRYSFAVNSGADSVSAMDHFHTSPVGAGAGGGAKVDVVEVARIVFNSDLPTTTLSPRNSVFSGDGTRLYVALNGGSGIAVIDTVALQEIDTDPDTFGVQHIQLPLGSRPFDLAAETNSRYLYVSDEASNVIYVVDIDPFSETFHSKVRSIAVGPAPLGLRGLALNADESHLFAAAPGRTIFGNFGATNGAVVIVQTNLATREEPGVPTIGPMSVAVGPEPYDVTATDDANVMLFVDRLDDSRGVGVLRRLAGSNFWDPNYVSIVEF
ncbi:MAG: Ig-like domain-containing protein, partial [Verrucomicrobiales bacterium]|nr:Ig-like domain-containing protein [Verrucomicrobiales bacterium]